MTIISIHQSLVKTITKITELRRCRNNYNNRLTSSHNKTPNGHLILSYCYELTGTNTQCYWSENKTTAYKVLERIFTTVLEKLTIITIL